MCFITGLCRWIYFTVVGAKFYGIFCRKCKYVVLECVACVLQILFSVVEFAAECCRISCEIY